MDLEAIHKCTDWQLINILFRPSANTNTNDPQYFPVPRHKPGDPVGPPEVVSFKEMAFQVWRRAGVTEESVLQARWEKYIRGDKELDKKLSVPGGAVGGE